MEFNKKIRPSESFTVVKLNFHLETSQYLFQMLKESSLEEVDYVVYDGSRFLPKKSTFTPKRKKNFLG